MSFLVGEQVVLTNTFLVGSTPTDPTTASLTVTDPAGVATTYTWAGGTINRTSVGVFTKTITATVAGTWTYTWVGTGAAADIAPAFFEVGVVTPSYVTLAEIRALPNLGDATKFTNAELAAAIDWFEETFESYTGVAWVPRTRTVTLEPYSNGTLMLPDYLPRRITAARIYTSATAYTDFTVAELDDLVLEGSGLVRRWGAYFTYGTRVQVTYTHGYDSPPADVVDAARRAIRLKLLEDHTGPRHYSVQTDVGVQRNYLPGEGKPFGDAEVDAVANRRAMTRGDVGSVAIG